MLKKIIFLIFFVNLSLFGIENKSNVIFEFNILNIASDNHDLRNIDNSNYKSVEYTDDFFYLTYGKISLSYYNFSEPLNFYTKISKSFFFGNDDALNNYNISLEKIYLEIIPNKNLIFKIGRDDFRTIDDKEIPDYVYSDIIDSFSFVFKSDFISFRAIIDLFSMNSPVYYYNIKSSKENIISYFNGNVNIFKTGGIIDFKFNFENLFFNKITTSPYFFYAHLGAVDSIHNNIGGNEKTIDGTLGNFADGDFLTLTGLNLILKSEFYKIGVQFAYSYGKDIKSPYIPDVELSGFIINGYLKLFWNFLFLQFSGVYSSGGEVNEKEIWKNFGFVSMKGDRIGGYIFKDLYGIYPSGIVDYDGINFLPFEMSRRAPLYSIMIATGIDKIKIFNSDSYFGVYIDSWFHWDNNKLNNKNLESNSLEFLKRLNKFMGIENDVKLSINFKNQIELNLLGGIFWSYDFFWKYPTSANVPLGNDLCWILASEINFRF